MSGLKNSNKLKKLAKIIGFYLVKIYQSNKNKKIIEVTETLLPKERALPLLLNPNLFYFVVVVILSGVILKDVLELSHPSKDLKKSPLDSPTKNKDLLDSLTKNKDLLDLPTKDKDLLDLASKKKNLLNLANQIKNLPQLPLIIPFPGKRPEKRPEKRILALHLCYPVSAKHSINKYVIFKQKNKDNPSHVHINRGEVVRIIKKLDKWDHVLVDFSIKVPSHFEKLNTKAIMDKVLSEAVFILEQPQLKKS